MAKKSATAVAVHDPRKAVQVAAPRTFLEFLHEAATNPAVDVGKMQAILDMKAKEDARASEAAFDENMARVQKALDPIRADMESAKPKNKYASAVKLDKAIRPIYSEHGFGVSFDTDECPQPLTVRVVAYVTNSGHRRRYFIDIPADGKGPSGGDVMSRTHAVGSAMTYGRGILLRAIFNLVVDKSDDDDGRAAGRTERPDSPINESQVKRLQTLLEQTNSSIPRFLEYLGEQSIMTIPASRFDEAVAMLNAKKQQAAK